MWDPKLANFYKERLHSTYAFDFWVPISVSIFVWIKTSEKRDMSNWFIDVTHSGPGLKLE